MIDQVDRSLVNTDWLAERIHTPGLRIVDARWRGDGSGYALYRAGHIPGAIHLDWQLDLSYEVEAVRYRILPPDRFAAAMSAAGIGDDTLVVAYADEDYSGAARIWWALRYHGHDRAAVLDGGISKWQAEGRPLTDAVTEPEPAAFTPRMQGKLLASRAEVQAAAEAPASGIRLVDTRPPEQYAGRAIWTPEGSLFLLDGEDHIDVGDRRMRGGRIPGAVHLQSSGNLDPASWAYLDPRALRKRALEAGLRTEDRVITYCGAGISASLGLFALHLAGFEDLGLYDASWEEWGTDPELPIER